MPRTPFIGVRISWLMRARNELFAWFAASAASRARRSASSLRLCCVTSRATAMLPMHWLVSSSSGATATWMSIAVRERVMRLGVVGELLAGDQALAARFFLFRASTRRC